MLLADTMTTGVLRGKKVVHHNAQREGAEQITFQVAVHYYYDVYINNTYEREMGK